MDSTLGKFAKKSVLSSPYDVHMAKVLNTQEHRDLAKVHKENVSEETRLHLKPLGSKKSHHCMLCGITH